MLRTNLFRFIAYTLEGVGQPEDDNPTIYGINKHWHLAEYLEMKKALETDNPITIQNTLEEVYTEIYEHSVAKYFKDYYPINFNVFDMSFNAGDSNATLCWQQTVNSISTNGYHLVEDGDWGNETSISLHILKQFPVVTLNEIYGYKRIKHYISKSKNTWIHGLINRVIKLQIHIIKMREE